MQHGPTRPRARHDSRGSHVHPRRRSRGNVVLPTSQRQSPPADLSVAPTWATRHPRRVRGRVPRSGIEHPTRSTPTRPRARPDSRRSAPTAPATRRRPATRHDPPRRSRCIARSIGPTDTSHPGSLGARVLRRCDSLSRTNPPDAQPAPDPKPRRARGRVRAPAGVTSAPAEPRVSTRRSSNVTATITVGRSRLSL